MFYRYATVSVVVQEDIINKDDITIPSVVLVYGDTLVLDVSVNGTTRDLDWEGKVFFADRLLDTTWTVCRIIQQGTLDLESAFIHDL